MPDNFVTAVVANLPNFAIAVWVIYSYQKTISGLLANQQILIQQLVAMVEEQQPKPPALENHASPPPEK